MQIERLNAGFGARIDNVNLASLSDTEFTQLQGLLWEQELLIIPGQSLQANELKTFASRLGELDIHPYIQSIPEHPEILPIVKEASESKNFGGGWHSEVSFYEAPAKATMLYAVDVPMNSGDTMVASQTLAFNGLSKKMQELLFDLVAEHSADKVYGPGGTYKSRQENEGTNVNVSETALARVEHPVIRVHPDTGKKSLYVNVSFTRMIKGLRRAESDVLLQFLVNHAVKTEYCARVRWQPGMLVIWDNRSTQHFALNDYRGQRREMLRVVVKGEKPLGVNDGSERPVKMSVE